MTDVAFRLDRARLGWLINPKSQQVEIYRQGEQKEYCTSPTNLFGEQVLPFFRVGLESNSLVAFYYM